MAFSATGDLYVADYTRETIDVKREQVDGSLGPLEPWATDVGGAVDLRTHGTDLFYVDVFQGQVVRLYLGLPGDPPPAAPRPHATIDRPTSDTKPVVNEQIEFSGSATDETGSPLPPSALRWTLVVLHCPNEHECHRHFVESRSGVSSGSFVVPAHEGDHRIEIVLRATGASGSDQTSVVLRQKPSSK